MFTGLIQGLGYLKALNAYQLQIDCADQPEQSAALILVDLALGDSVAVNGACLTVEKILPRGFIVSISPETLRRTTLGENPAGLPVNLETSLRVGSKLGGHFVSGHVDGQATLASAQSTATSWEMRFTQVSPALRPYLLEKGSIAVNGVSLTIATCAPRGEWFTVAVIPHTYALTNLHCLSPDSPVNLEADLLGKYVHRLLQWPLSSGGTSAGGFDGDALDGNAPMARPQGITADFLGEHGYL